MQKQFRYTGQERAEMSLKHKGNLQQTPGKGIMKVSPQQNAKKILTGISFGQMPIHTPHDSGKYIITETRVCASPARPDRRVPGCPGGLGLPFAGWRDAEL